MIDNRSFGGGENSSPDSLRCALEFVQLGECSLFVTAFGGDNLDVPGPKGAVRSFFRPSRLRATLSPLTVRISEFFGMGRVVFGRNTLPIDLTFLFRGLQFQPEIDSKFIRDVEAQTLLAVEES